MAVTTREYTTSSARPRDIINLMHDAIADLSLAESVPLGYICNFTNTPGSTLATRANERYLVTATTTTASSGTEAVFDILRTPVGGISAVTLVTGGEGYNVFGIIGASSAGTTVTVPSTAGINSGMVVTRVGSVGAGTLQSNTLVTAVLSSTTFSIDQTPSVALSGGAIISLADTLTIGAGSIGGSTYSVSTTGTSGQAILFVTTSTNIFPGQRVYGPGVGSLCVVNTVAGNTLTISKANTGTVNGNITFSDEITVTVTGISGAENLTGSVSGFTITNVASNLNIFAGATVEVQSGPTWDASNGRAIVSAVAGTGPYTVTLRNEENTFKGFTTTGTVTFRATGAGISSKWMQIDNHTAPTTYAWAIAKIKNANSGKLKNTFWLFYAGYTGFPYGVFLGARALTGYNGISAVFQGVGGLDFIVATGSTVPTYAANFQLSTVVASSAYTPIKLKIRQSALDTNFATFSFYEGNNNRNPFFIPKYNNPSVQPWSYDDVFLTGATEIVNSPIVDVNDAGILFRTRVGAARRMAESGYSSYVTALTSGPLFRSLSGNRSLVTAATHAQYSFYTRQLGDLHTSVTTQYPVYKNIPVNPTFFPVPYYLPEDFVLIELPWLNAAIGDTVTVSPSEIYTIIQLATNQVTYTSLALAVRTT